MMAVSTSFLRAHSLAPGNEVEDLGKSQLAQSTIAKYVTNQDQKWSLCSRENIDILESVYRDPQTILKVNENE